MERLARQAEPVLDEVSATLAVAWALPAKGGRRRWRSAASGVAPLAGSLCLRFGIYAGGVVSAKDPRYTVVPQRHQLDRQGA